VETWLEIRAPAWEGRICVIGAGGRDAVISALGDRRFTNAFGLVDRDTWTATEAEEARRFRPGRLFVTEGWCIENDLLRDEPSPPPDPWIRHGAWWWVSHRARAAMNHWFEGARFPPPGPTTEVDVREALGESAPSAVVDDLVRDWQAREAEVQAWHDQRQWLEGVHGKAFVTANRRERLALARQLGPPEEGAIAELLAVVR
jgi:hypothetical protein